MTRPRRTSLAIVLAACCLAVGCGSAGSDASVTGSQLIAKADPICKRLAVQREVANALLKQSKNPKATIVHEAPIIAADELQAVERLSALKPPSALAGDWRKLLADMHHLATYTRELGRYDGANNKTKAQAVLAVSQHLHIELVAIGTRDGFRYCGRAS